MTATRGHVGPAGARTSSRVRCLIADSSTYFCDGLAAALGNVPSMEVTGCTHDPAQVRALVDRTGADVLLLGFLPVAVSVDVARGLLGSARPGQRRTAVAMMIAPDSNRADVVAAVRTGVSAFLERDANPSALVAALRSATTGTATMPAEVLQAIGGWMEVPRREWDSALLTAREQDVLALVVDGHSTRAIAQRLGVAEQTVKNHVHHIMTKTATHSRGQLAAWAGRQDLAG